MDASARETGQLRQRTADDNLQTEGLVRLRRLEDGSSSDEDDSDSELDNDHGGSDASGEFDESLLEGLVLGDGGGGGDAAERAVLDAQFEAVSTVLPLDIAPPCSAPLRSCEICNFPFIIHLCT